MGDRLPKMSNIHLAISIFVFCEVLYTTPAHLAFCRNIFDNYKEHPKDTQIQNDLGNG